jgi:tRNA pseudouridine13 synthase
MRYRECGTAEADIGMRYYLTDAEGTGGRLKTEPEDFIVREISVRPEPKEGGRHVIAEVTARNWETNRLIRIMSRNLGISRERIGFAGTKDKRAVTTQLMSFEMPLDRLERIELRDLDIRGAYTGRRAIRIGDLIGNSFGIRVRGCDVGREGIGAALTAVEEGIGGLGGFPNYFGVQRFGTIRPITHTVGEHLVRGDPEAAVRTYLSGPSEHEGDDISAAREMMADGDDWSSYVGDMPESLSFERTLVQHLAGHPDDWNGAISALPRNLQMMFVHAYQSYLFNLMLSGRMEAGLPLDAPVAGDTVIPLDADGIPRHEDPVIATGRNLDLVEMQVRAGRAYVAIPLFGSESTIAEGEMGEIVRKVIGEAGVGPSDFIVPGLGHCSSKGSYREAVCPVKDLEHSIADDDGYTVSFSLPKGNYATCLMREYMKSPMENY